MNFGLAASSRETGPHHSAPFGRELLQHVGRSWSIVDHHPVPQDQRRVGLNRHLPERSDAWLYHPENVMPAGRWIQRMIHNRDADYLTVALEADGVSYDGSDGQSESGLE